MRPTGICKIIVTDLNGNTKRTHTQFNIICKRAIERLLYHNLPVFIADCKIAFSSNSPAIDYEKITISNVIAIGNNTPEGATGYTLTEPTETEPRSATYHNRFLFPASERTINSIAILPSGTTNNAVANTTEDIYAYLPLDVPLVQASNEIIDIFYKVYIDWTSPFTNIDPGLQEALTERFFGLSVSEGIGYNGNKLLDTIISPNQGDRELRSDIGHLSYRYISNRNRYASGKSFNPTASHNLNLLKLTYKVNVNISGRINQHIFGLSYGKLDHVYSFNRDYGFMYGFKRAGGAKQIDVGTSLTPVHAQNQNSRSLLRNVNFLGNSSWFPNISSDSTGSYDALPTVYSLNVENSGGVGIGSYSIYKSNYSGVSAYYVNDLINQAAYPVSARSDWVQHPTQLVVTQKFPHAIGSDWLPINDRWIYPWTSDCLWVSGDKTTIALWRIFPELNIELQWDLSLQGVIQINDLACDPESETIYAATEEGLYSIDVTADSITELNADPCKAVDFGFNNSIFAVFSDRLASSLNPSWSDTHDLSGISEDFDFNRTIFIRCDRTSESYQLALLEHRVNPHDSLVLSNYNNSWYSRIHWWDNTNNYSNTTDLNVTASNIEIYLHPTTTHPTNNSFVVKDGLWVLPGVASYGNTNFDSLNLNFLNKLLDDLPDNPLCLRNAQGNVRLKNNVATPTLYNFAIAVCNFGVRLNGQGVTDPVRLGSGGKSFAILNSDISNNYLALVASGYQSGYYQDAQDRNLYYYDAGKIRETVGALEVAVNPDGNNVDGFKQYRDEIHGASVAKYVFSYYLPFHRPEPLFCLNGNVAPLKNGGVIGFSNTRTRSVLSQTMFERGVYADNTYYTPFTISTWGAPYVEDRNNSDWGIRLGWNDLTNQWEESEILPGKPLHTAEEPLIDGLNISWSDLNPGDTSDFIAGQFYNFINLPNSTGLVNDGSLSNFDFEYSYYLRPVATDIAVAGAIADNIYTIPEATSDNLWLCLDYTDLSTIEITIAGYSVPALIISTGTPNPNEILLQNATEGILQFSPDDEGKAITGTILYLQKIHETEVL